MDRESLRADEGIDWTRVRALVKQASEANTSARDPERVREILEERARILAAVPPREPLASEVLQLATLSIRGERYAIETRFVRRIGRLDHYTPVPGAPPLLLGVFNSGGEILPLFDLASLFGANGGEGSEGTHLVVFGEADEEFGGLVNGTDEVLTLGLEEILSSSSVAETAGRALIRGITEDALIVIDGEQLLSDDRLKIDQGTEG